MLVILRSVATMLVILRSAATIGVILRERSDRGIALSPRQFKSLGRKRSLVASLLRMTPNARTYLLSGSCVRSRE
jgi:hypothetical protein